MMDNLSLGKDFDEITIFLAEHRWMFDFKLTHIFQDCVFKNTPEEWKDTLKVLSGEQLTGLPFGHVQSTWPESLKLFIERCMEFAFPREVTMSYTEQYHIKNGRVPALGPCAANLDGKLQSLSDEASGLNKRRETTLVTDGFTRFTPLDVCDLDADIKKGMSAKKLHEVCHMTSLIDHVTRVAGNNGVVDVGSGLGYLGQVLHSYYGHSVLGLEGKQGHTTGADKRLNKFACAGHLHNVTCELHADARSQQEFMILVKDWFSKLTRSRCSHQKTGSKSFPQTGSSQIQAKVSPAENIQIDKNRHADRNSSSERQNSLSASEQTGTLNTASDSLTGSMLSASEQTGTLNTASDSLTGSMLSASEQTGTLNTASDSLTGSMLSASEQTGTLNTASDSLTGSMLSASEQTGTLNTASDSLTGSMLSASEQTGTLNTASDSLTGSMLSASEQTGTLNTASDSLTGSMLPASELTGTLNTASASLTGSMLSASELTSTQNTAANSVTGSKSSDCLQPASVSHSTVQICSDTSKSQDFGGKLDSVHTTNECSEMPESCYNDRNVGKSAEKSEKTELSSGLETPQLCMAGLHCCGDLTPTMLKYFVELDAVTSLCCVSCCYHRMKYTEGSQEPQNFPMSKLLKESVSKTRKIYPDFTFSSYSLRLAAQETRARWQEQTTEDHEFHMKNVAYRGVLETCLQQDDKRFELKKCVRKLAHRDDYDSFSDYIDAVFRHIQTPQTVSEDSFRELFQSEMQKGYDLHHQYFCMIEPLTALQYLLQPVIESLIYQDRKQWLKEQGYHADIVPVFDELISPRNLAIVAYKNNCE